MTNKPNNFPREGQHSPVTRDALRAMENERPVLNCELHYTIGGGMEADVHSNVYAEREAAITNGSRRLNRASDTVQHGFTAAKPGLKSEYIRAQQKVATRTPRQHKRREPSR